MTSNDEKGFLRLIEIWKMVQKDKKYQNWTLTIVGEGELKNTIKEKIKENKLKNIILKPFTKEIEKRIFKCKYLCNDKQVGRIWNGFNRKCKLSIS